MTIVLSIAGKENVAFGFVLSLGRAAGRRRSYPRSRFQILKLVPDDQIAGVFERPQVGGQFAAGQFKHLLGESIGQPVRFRPEGRPAKPKGRCS